MAFLHFVFAKEQLEFMRYEAPFQYLPSRSGSKCKNSFKIKIMVKFRTSSLILYYSMKHLEFFNFSIHNFIHLQGLKLFNK